MSPRSNLDLHIDIPDVTNREGFIFISYKNEEAAAAEKIRTALKRAGFAVWWDRQIQCGQAWNQVLDDAVRMADCVVVLWSSRATQSSWVAHEASVALARNNYAPIRIELCAIPAPYDQLQATDIIDWDGESDHPGVRNLLNRCSTLMPMQRTLGVRLGEALWKRRGTAVAVMFGATALGILTWQTVAGRSQLRQLNAVAAQQTEATVAGRLQLRQLNAVAVQQTEATRRLDQFQRQVDQGILPRLSQLSANATEQTAAAERIASQSLESTHRLEGVANNLDRALRPLGNMAVFIADMRVPTDELPYQSYFQKIDSVFSTYIVMDDLSRLSIEGLSMPVVAGYEQGKPIAGMVAMSEQHRLFPSIERSLAGVNGIDQVLAGTLEVTYVNLSFYRRPIDPRTLLFSSGRADLEISLHSAAPLELAKDFIGNHYILTGQLDNEHRKDNTGAIISIPDLAGSQIFLVVGPLGLREEHNQEFQRLRRKFEIGDVALQIGNQTVWIRDTQWKKHTAQDGITFWEFRFPTDYEQILTRPRG